MYDPKSQKFTVVNTCFPTHHVQFGFDANNTLWASAAAASGAAGWINVKMLEETGDEVKSQGWTPFILDTNGNGKRDEYTEPNQPLDPAKDRRINVAFYGVSPSRDGTVWGTSLGYPGSVVRLDPTKPNPSETALAEVYEVPAPGYGPRGMDIDTNNVVWVPMASGHMAPSTAANARSPTVRPCDRPPLPRGLDVLSVPGPRLPATPATDRPRRATTPG